MEFLGGALRVFLFYIIFTNIIRIIFTLINRKKIAERLKDMEKQKDTQMKDSQDGSLETSQEIEYVRDPVCDCEVEKHNAYILLEGDEDVYFCSWDCRQEYIDRKNGKEPSENIRELKDERNKHVNNKHIRNKDEVIDPICKSRLDKDDAYILVEDDEKKYFCSWDCRQEYIDKKKEN